MFNYFLSINELKSEIFLNTGLTKSPSIFELIFKLPFIIFAKSSKVSSNAFKVLFISFFMHETKRMISCPSIPLLNNSC